MITKIINGHLCGWYNSGRFWVSEDGTVAYKHQASKRSYKMFQECRGKVVFIPPRSYRLVGKAVLEAFAVNSQVPAGFSIGYKDGDRQNCNKNNLDWVAPSKFHSNEPQVTLFCGGVFLTVKRNGEIEEYNQPLHISRSFFDGDTDSWQSFKPYVRIDGHLHYVEEILDTAGFIQGDDTVLSHPVVLHKDLDWQNVDSSNMEWVEQTDPRWTAYEAKAVQDMNDYTRQLNGNNQFPNHYLRTRLP